MNVMKRAWEIYRTLTGDHIAKLSVALRKAWAEIKNAVKNVKEECINRMNTIIAASNTVYNRKIVAKDWENYGKNRTYLSIVETGRGTSHYKKYDFGFIDNNTNEYVAGKWDVRQNYNLAGSNF